MRKIVAVLIVVPMLFGCVALDKVKDTYNNLTQKDRATIEGGALGAGIGALAGQIIGGDTQSTVAGAVIGGIIGAIAANWYAKQALARQDELKGKENDLKARIEYAQNVNADALKYNQNLEKQLQATKREIEDLRIKEKQNKITRSAMEKERQKMAKKIKTAKDNEKLMALQLKELKDFRSQNTNKSDELDAEIARLEKSLGKVKENTIELASLEV